MRGTDDSPQPTSDRANRWRRTGYWLAAFLLVNSVAGSAAQSSPRSLGALTVPAGALPVGCGLEPPADPSRGAVQAGSRLWPGSGLLFPDNPWFGTDIRLAGAIRDSIDPTLVAKPDGQSVDPSATSVSRGRHEDVREAYRAVYGASDGSRTHVEAVTFVAASFVKAEPVSAMTNPPRGLSRRFVRDTTVVRVSATTPDACTRAIVSHIQSVM
ncbi:MAG: hypothetical protein IT183_08090 [Acidobacteria bacterium]|nr:hypothetical protein [Acidobacteriota bacterium]